MKIHCPYCSAEIDFNLGKHLSKFGSPKKSEQSRKNGAKGGRPKGSKNQKGKL